MLSLRQRGASCLKTPVGNLDFILITIEIYEVLGRGSDMI